jgi:hypothetical protein
MLVLSPKINKFIYNCYKDELLKLNNICTYTNACTSLWSF